MTESYPGTSIRVHVAMDDGDRYGQNVEFIRNPAPIIVGQSYPMPYGRPHGWDRGYGWGEHEHGYSHHERDDD